MQDRPYISSNFSQFICLCPTLPQTATRGHYTLVFKGDPFTCKRCHATEQARRYYCDCKPDALTLLDAGAQARCQFCRSDTGRPA